VEQHEYDAGRFAELVESADASAGDWGRHSPVEDWTALGVVDHLITWLPGYLSRNGIQLAEVDLGDPVTAWSTRAAEIHALLRERGDEEWNSPMFGKSTLGAAVNQIYTTDVWMHSWDLARALGRPFDMGEERCEAVLAGMLPMDQVLRDSGQFGPQVAVPADASAQDRLLGFIGRDPGF
jgi:uncharacterized protein (TIGR03086 family)